MLIFPQRTQVLIVDDDEAVREALRDLLEDEGYSVLEVPDGRLALEQLKTHPHGLVVIVDWAMPRMDGEAFLQAVAADPRLATEHAYILLTAYRGGRTMSLSFVRTLRHLGVHVLGQPFNIDHLLEAVKHVAAHLSSA